MKKFVSVIAAALILSLSCLPVFAEKEGGITAENYVDAKNSGFEDAKSITDTVWFRLVSSTGGDTNGIELKTDGGHTGKNYIQAKIEQSWYSPAINIYPFLKEAGEGTYRIAVYMRSSSSSFVPKNFFVVRGKEADITDSEVFPFIGEKSDNNFYGTPPGKAGAPDDNKWILFVSEPLKASISGGSALTICRLTLHLILTISEFTVTMNLKTPAKRLKKKWSRLTFLILPKMLFQKHSPQPKRQKSLLPLLITIMARQTAAQTQHPPRQQKTVICLFSFSFPFAYLSQPVQQVL